MYFKFTGMDKLQKIVRIFFQNYSIIYQEMELIPDYIASKQLLYSRFIAMKDKIIIRQHLQILQDLRHIIKYLELHGSLEDSHSNHKKEHHRELIDSLKKNLHSFETEVFHTNIHSSKL